MDSSTQRFIIYTRVSTVDQADSGVSLQAQLARCRDYARLYGLEVVDEVQDAGASAKSLDRDGWRRVARMQAYEEADGIIVAKMDRLTRSLGDLADLLDDYFTCGVTLHAVDEKVDTSSANGRAMINMMMVMSQWEREAISERTRAALQHKKATGQKYRGPGAPPFGWAWKDGELVENGEEQKVVKLVMTMRADGETVASISRRLNNIGAMTRRGGAWHPTTVNRMLKLASNGGKP